MLFNNIRLIGHKNIDLPIHTITSSTPYILKSADGLGPPEIDIMMSNVLTGGGLYQTKRVQNKQIILRIGLNPQYPMNLTVGDLRSDLYGLLSPNPTATVKIELRSFDTVLMQTVGYVKRIEIAPFSKDPEVQITIECESAYFQSPNSIELIPSDGENIVVENVGTAPAGFTAVFQSLATVSSFNMFHLSEASQQMTVNGRTWVSGDVTTFVTTPKSRSVSVYTTLGTINLLPYIKSPFVWLQLHSGINTFSYPLGPTRCLSFTYTPHFWGI